MAMSSCVDNNYDISDIDTTVEVRVNDLIIPINLEQIKLGTILDLDPNDRIQNINDKYALVEDGEINSNDISIGAIFINSPHINPIHKEISINSFSSKSNFETALPTIHLEDLLSSFNYSYYNVDNSIKGIKNVSTNDFYLGIAIQLTDPTGTLNNLKFKNLDLQLPSGLDGTVTKGNYDKHSGIVSLGEVNLQNGKFYFTININKIDLLPPMVTFDVEKHEFVFATNIGISKAEIEIESISGTTFPSNLALDINFTLPDLNINSFSGIIDYEFSGFTINAVDLNDLPDILTQSQTNIGITNPQIYMTLNNPLDIYGLYATASIGITPVRDNVSGTTYSPDNGAFEIGKVTESNPVGSIFNYCLSPQGASDEMKSSYTNLTDIKFTTLSDVLSGNGIPQSLSIEIENPRVPDLQVTDLKIGENLGKIHGEYKLYAPLAFTENTKIVYSSEETGWSSDDLNAITISTLEIKTTVKNGLPISINLSGNPLDVNGSIINNVEIEGAEIEGNTTKDVTIKISGAIKGLDGIKYEAIGTTVNSEIALSPSQAIELTNIRAKVSGSYIKEL